MTEPPIPIASPRRRTHQRLMTVWLTRTMEPWPKKRSRKKPKSSVHQLRAHVAMKKHAKPSAAATTPIARRGPKRSSSAPTWGWSSAEPSVATRYSPLIALRESFRSARMSSIIVPTHGLCPGPLMTLPHVAATRIT